MRVFVATEAVVCRVDNAYYTNNSFIKTLERYYNVFHEIVLCTRIRACKKSDLPISFVEATDYISDTVDLSGLMQAALGKKDREMKQKIRTCKLVIARVPSVVANRAANISRKLKIPYMVEVVGCIWDSYWNYSLSSKPLAGPSYLSMRHVVKNADYAMYVTENFLQRRYPCSCESIHASNVKIDCGEKGVIENRLKRIENKKSQTYTLFTAAAIDVAYKGQEYVIRAMKILRGKGIHVQYRLAGNGDKARLTKIAEENGVLDQIVFLGGLPHEDVITEMDHADIYIQPSLQEGLPRSVIEAMSRGCPCLGAKTAGIPELIDPECVFKRANPEDTARAIEQIIQSDMTKYAKKNYQKSLEFDFKVLEERRNRYYQKIISEVG